MFGIGMYEILLILVIALIVIGPKQLPEMARMLGRGMAVLRKARDELTEEIRDTIDLERHVHRFRSDFEKYIQQEQESLNEAVDKSGQLTPPQHEKPEIQKDQQTSPTTLPRNEQPEEHASERSLTMSEHLPLEAEKADKPPGDTQPLSQKDSLERNHG